MKWHLRNLKEVQKKKNSCMHIMVGELMQYRENNKDKDEKNSKEADMAKVEWAVGGMEIWGKEFLKQEVWFWLLCENREEKGQSYKWEHPLGSTGERQTDLEMWVMRQWEIDSRCSNKT